MIHKFERRYWTFLYFKKNSVGISNVRARLIEKYFYRNFQYEHCVQHATCDWPENTLSVVALIFYFHRFLELLSYEVLLKYL